MATDEFPKKKLKLHENLLNLLRNINFEIYLDKENTNVFKKLMPSLHRFKEDLIITVDDDVLYP